MTDAPYFVHEKALVESFAAEKGRKLEVEIESVRRIGGDVLSAKGTSVLTFPGGGSTAKSFTALHVKKDGRWLISELTESELVQNISPAEAMKSLEGLAGTWEHKGEGITLHTVAAWSPGLRFLTRTTKIQIPGAAEEQTTEIIGWDASVGALRSWTFSSNGCVSEGVWAPSKTGWSIATVTTLPDGSAATDDSTIERVDERTLTLSTMNRVIAGEAQPGIAPITFQGSAP